jgi:hypothetical protein
LENYGTATEPAAVDIDSCRVSDRGMPS